MGPWIGFSSRRNIAVAGNMLANFRVSPLQDSRHFSQYLILNLAKLSIITALKFNPDRIIITLYPAQIAGAARVPGTIIEIDELQDFTATQDQKMGGNLHTANGLEIRMGIPVKLVLKKLFNIAPPQIVTAAG